MACLALHSFLHRKSWLDKFAATATSVGKGNMSMDMVEIPKYTKPELDGKMNYEIL